MAWTAPRTWVTGETVTAVIMNQAVRDNLLAVGGTFVYKSADETVNNSTTLQDDDDLKFTVGTNELWIFQFMLNMTDASDGTADTRIAFTGPASAGAAWAIHPSESITSVFESSLARGFAPDVDIQSGANAANGGRLHNVSGRIDTAGTAGTLQLQWSQATANASDLKMLAGSWLTAREVT